MQPLNLTPRASLPLRARARANFGVRTWVLDGLGHRPFIRFAGLSQRRPCVRKSVFFGMRAQHATSFALMIPYLWNTFLHHVRLGPSWNQAAAQLRMLGLTWAK